MRAPQHVVAHAARGVREDVLGRTHERLSEAGALRRPEASAAAGSVPDQP